MSIFGERLKTLRKEKNLLTKQFADAINVSASTITYWEKGIRTPKVDILIKIADYFNCSIDYLLGRTDNLKLELYNNYPHELMPEEVELLLTQLDSTGININKLVESLKETVLQKKHF